MYAQILRAFVLVSFILCPMLSSAQGLRVVARVNDDAISDYEVNQRVILAIRTTNQADSPDLRQRIAPQMLRQMIDERLQIQDAKKLGLRATDGEIAQRVGEIERSANLAPGQFKLYLQQFGVPYEVAAQQLEATISWLKIVRRRIRGQVDVSDTEIDDALARMRANIGKTESRVGEIFIPIDRPDQAEEARRAADRVVEQLRRGAPFQTLAQQFSHGATAQAGGDLGWILPGTLDPALDAAIEKLPAHGTSDPIRTSAGWHILFVADRRAFASARPDEIRLNLVQLTLALPVNASGAEVDQATSEAQRAMGKVHQCGDLHLLARSMKGASSGDLSNVRVADLVSNRQMYDDIPKLAIGAVAGPYRVAEGLQIVSLCAKEGNNGLPTRDSISQQIILTKLEAASRRYMRDLRRSATIDLKP
jgi:peptidyl-prolyl cis-trans isomerase SurA